jgi:hypothetical protein
LDFTFSFSRALATAWPPVSRLQRYRCSVVMLTRRRELRLSPRTEDDATANRSPSIRPPHSPLSFVGAQLYPELRGNAAPSLAGLQPWLGQILSFRSTCLPLPTKSSPHAFHAGRNSRIQASPPQLRLGSTGQRKYFHCARITTVR